MLRRLVPLLVAGAVVALGALFACGGTKDFTFDAGGLPVTVDAGPCDPVTSSNCASTLKCSIYADGGPVCAPKGSNLPYAACNADSDCPATTACVDLEYVGYVPGKHCFPFCNPTTEPTDGGTNCPSANKAAKCFHPAQYQATLGFCDLPDGGA